MRFWIRSKPWSLFERRFAWLPVWMPPGVGRDNGAWIWWEWYWFRDCSLWYEVMPGEWTPPTYEQWMGRKPTGEKA